MRNLSFCGEKWDKRYALAFIIALSCSIICGIVLCRFVNYNYYLRNLADEYVYNVFNFKNAQIVFPHFLGDLLYFYIFFLIGYFTKFKYVSLVFVFLRGIFFGIYTVLIISVGAFSGVVTLIFVFIPATLISLVLCYACGEFCPKCDKRYCLFIPAAVALADLIIILLLENVIFRVVIIIV